MKLRIEPAAILEALLVSGFVSAVIIVACAGSLGASVNSLIAAFPLCWLVGAAVYAFLAALWRQSGR